MTVSPLSGETLDGRGICWALRFLRSSLRALASRYRFSFETKNAATQTLFAYTGSFHTNGTDAPEGIEDINAKENAQKVLIDGQIYILRGDRLYTHQGQEVK